VAKITEEMKEVAAKARLFAVATVAENGEPNVVPIAFAKVFSDDEILLMDNFMKRTEENLKANPKVAVSVWDVNWETLTAKAFQFKGDARFEYSGKIFNEGREWVKSMIPINSKAAIVVKVKSIYDISPPGP
jgi:predicted pyridoxine 5'-phosphate oxidase superfamily flavin-nucleotide-binding protein